MSGIVYASKNKLNEKRITKFENICEKFEKLFPEYVVIGFDPSFLVMKKDLHTTFEIPMYFMEDLLGKIKGK